MLRGTGSLQGLLGRALGAKRKFQPNEGGANGSLPTEAPAVAPAAEQPAVAAVCDQMQQNENQCESQGQALPPQQQQRKAKAAAKQQRCPESPLRPGHVRCPICARQLRDDATQVNHHIDTCLARPHPRWPSGPMLQSTLLQFTQRSGSSNTHFSGLAQPADVQYPVAQREQQQQQGGAAVQVAAASSTEKDAKSPGPQQQQQQQQQGSSQEAPEGATDQRHQQRQQQRQQPSLQRPSPPSQQPSPAQAWRTPPPLARLPAVHRLGAGELRCFPACIVGRRYASTGSGAGGGDGLAPGTRLLVEPEDGNPRDAHALRVLCSASRAPLGHLPRALARHLGPLLRSGAAVAEAVVAEAPAGEGAAVPVELQVSLAQASPAAAAAGAGPGSGRGRAARTAGASAAMAAALDRAERAAAAALEALPRATGERLHLNFLTILEHVQRHEGHLLLPKEEGRFIAAYQARRGQPQVAARAA